MKVAESRNIETQAINKERTLTMAQGLLGFEEIKQYALTANPEEEPFLWMRARAGGLDLAFVVLSPYEVLGDYHPDIPNDDARSLDISKPEDAWVLSIVTMRGGGRATVNLKGPLVINRHTLIAKQVVIVNAADYPLDYPLPVASE